MGEVEDYIYGTMPSSGSHSSFSPSLTTSDQLEPFTIIPPQFFVRLVPLISTLPLHRISSLQSDGSIRVCNPSTPQL